MHLQLYHTFLTVGPHTGQTQYHYANNITLQNAVIFTDFYFIILILFFSFKKPDERTSQSKCRRGYKMAFGITLVTAVMILVIGLSMAASTMHNSNNDYGYPNVNKLVGLVLNTTPLIDG